MSSYDQTLNAPAGSGAEKDKQGGPGVEPSGHKGDNPATAGPGPTGVHSGTPENKEGHIDPSAPGNAGVTPGSTGDK